MFVIDLGFSKQKVFDFKILVGSLDVPNISILEGPNLKSASGYALKKLQRRNATKHNPKNIKVLFDFTCSSREKVSN